MGKYKFRLSEMVPNAWFYKLRDMGHDRRRNQNFSIRRGFSYSGTSQLPRKSFTSPSSPPKLSFVPNRALYHYSTTGVEEGKHRNSPNHLTKRLDTGFLLHSPRKSKRSRRRYLKVLINSPSPRLVSSSASMGCNCSNGRGKKEINPMKNHETREFEGEEMTSFTDFISDTSSKRCSNSKKLETTKSSGKMMEIALSPIRIRSDVTFKDNDDSFYLENKRRHLKTQRSSQVVHRICTRVASPRVATKNTTTGKKSNKGLKESVAVVKSSSDPKRDFEESMIEMIIANNMRSSSDLEDLLACFLSLNSIQYHGVIVKVFKQVWLDLNKFRIIG